MEFSLFGLWDSMGLSARLVVLLLAFLSIYSLAIIAERGMLLRRVRLQSTAFAEETAGDSAGVAELQRRSAADARGEYNILGRVVDEALTDTKPVLESRESAGVVLESGQLAVTRSMTLSVAILRKRMVHLASTAAGAPFLGLFGTVLGLIRAFQTIASTGSGGITSVSAGIAEALITTLVGLFVAIPALWAHNFLADRIDTLAVEIDNRATRLVEAALRVDLGRRGA